MDEMSKEMIFLDFGPSLKTGFVKNPQGAEVAFAARLSRNSVVEIFVDPAVNLNLIECDADTEKTANLSLEQILSSASLPSPSISDYSMIAIYEQLSQLGWHRVVNLNADMSEASFRVRDRSGRTIHLKLDFSDKFPLNAPRVISDELPAEFNFEWNDKGSLCDILHKFEETVESLHDFWMEMDDIDNNVWILHPTRPSLSDKTRKIGLTRHTSVEVTIDPTQPRAFPKLFFIGSEEDTVMLRNSVNINSAHWNEELNVVENLRLLLDTSFPAPSSSQKEDVVLECLICSSYGDDGDRSPDQTCSKCQLMFHQHCLYQWLLRKQTRRQMSFGCVMGPCPHCKQTMKVKVPTL